MDIEASFARLTPSPWSTILALAPLERAKRFVVPLEEDIEKVGLAKALLGEVLAGRESIAGVRWRYSGTDEEKAECFNQAATFYQGCFCAARDILQADDPSVSMMWPCIEFDYLEKCHATCFSLRKKRFPRKHPVVRTFYPPWHFGCWSHASDSDLKPSRNPTPAIQPEKMRYFHNPIDVLVSQGLTQDFPGVDFGCQASAVHDLASFRDGLT